MEQARASGAFTKTHDLFWSLARRRLGDKDGTLALINVLLLHRSNDEIRCACRHGGCHVCRNDRSGRRCDRSQTPSEPAAAIATAEIPDGLSRFDRPEAKHLALRPTTGGIRMTKMTDTAATASIGAATESSVCR